MPKIIRTLAVVALVALSGGLWGTGRAQAAVAGKTYDLQTWPRPPLPQWGIKSTRVAVEPPRLTRSAYAATLGPMPTLVRTAPADPAHDTSL
jgi:hypothetical protein